MKKYIYKNEEVNSIIIDESNIISILWVNNALDFVIIIDWNGQYDLKDEFDFMNIETRLIFNWVTNLKIDLNWNNNQIGSPEISSFSFQKQLNGTYNINLDCNFDSIGYVNFNCNDFCFEIIE
jgi:hypothetical protein